MRALTAFLIALVGTLTLSPVARRVAVALGILDRPGHRKVHRKPIPRLGGIAVFLGWVVAVGVAAQMPPDPVLIKVFYPTAVVSSLVLCLGIWDDWCDLPGKIKLTGQVLLASVVFWLGLRINQLTNPLGGELFFPAPLSYLLTVLWIVGMMNSVNLIDGLDGLAAGIVAIASTGLVAASFYVRSHASVVILAALVGACVGFLRHNFYPAQMFLGDSGSQLLGFILAVAALAEQQYKTAAAVALLMPLTALALPILDTALAFARRIRWRRSIFKADKYHLHHRLLKMGLSHRQVVLFLYLVCGYLSLMSFLFVLIKDQYALILLILLAIGAFVGMQALRFVELKFLAFRRQQTRQLRVLKRMRG